MFTCFYICFTFFTFQAKIWPDHTHTHTRTQHVFQKFQTFFQNIFKNNFFLIFFEKPHFSENFDRAHCFELSSRSSRLFKILWSRRWTKPYDYFFRVGKQVYIVYIFGTKNVKNVKNVRFAAYLLDDFHVYLCLHFFTFEAKIWPTVDEKKL